MSELTQETAEKVLLADLANILKKAKSGKPLTRYERELVAESAQKEQSEKILSPDQAETILKGDLRNLAKKVKDGKTLSGSERALLQSTIGAGKVSDERFAKNQVELAEVLGVDRKTVQRWKKIEGNPGARPDGRYDIHAWRTWSNDHRGIDESETLSQAQLKAKQILLQNQKIEAHLAIVRKEYVPASEVEKWGSDLGAAIRKIVTQIHLAAPSVAGVSVPEAEERLKEIETEILEQLHTLETQVADWQEGS
jgi:hypothetical protein